MVILNDEFAALPNDYIRNAPKLLIVAFHVYV